MTNACMTTMIGRFGNQLFQYAYARAYADQHNLELRTPVWDGEKLFSGVPTANRPDGSEQVLGGYGQRQVDLIYTRTQVKQWFTWKPYSRQRRQTSVYIVPVAAHLRRGDYPGYGYPLVSQHSYEKACLDFDLGAPFFVFEEGGNPWLHDFYQLQQARILLRANSSFSWWAGTLGNGDIYSPIIDGLEGGKEHDCQFVAGNWPRLHTLDITTDLHLSE